MARAKQANSTKSSQNTLPSDLVVLVLKEGTLLGVLLVAVFCFVSLMSYSPQDPGLTSSGSNLVIENAMGRTGAWVADMLLSFIGYSAYILPLLLIYRAWLIFRDRQGSSELSTGLALALKVAGSIALILGLSSLFQLSTVTNQEMLPFGGGGYLGQVINSGLSALFSQAAIILLMIAVTLFGLTLYGEVSWLDLTERVGAFTLQSLAAFREWFADWQEQQREIARHKKENKQVVTERMLETSVSREANATEDDSGNPLQSLAGGIKDGVQKSARTIVSVFDNEGTDKSTFASGADAAKEKTKKRKPAKRLVNKSGQNTGLPSLDILDQPEHDRQVGYTARELDEFSNLLEAKLLDFGVSAEVKSVLPGPVITRFEIQPATGVKVSRITNLAKDLARSLAVVSVRVVEVIPGKSYVGIEIPNANRSMVYFSEVLQSDVYQDAVAPTSLALGHDISGQPIVADLAKMPHLLIAGRTGAGKSVGVNAMLLSLLYKATPEQVRLILIDPKMLELNVYEGIPHLLAPVITDMKDAANGLRWCVGEMERRYRLMASLGVRHLAGYNTKVKEAIDNGEPIADPTWQPDPLSTVAAEDQIAPDLTTLPSIVVVIDEFADMMMIVGKKVEQLIARIAQKARAAGIHLVLATQRPSVDVITGLIKANVPTRIGFQVSSRVDSRTILDQGGAEQLLGHGDMLYLPPGSGVPMRVHGAFVSDEEVHRVCDDWRERAEPDYIPDVTEGGSSDSLAAVPGMADEDSEDSDPLYDEAVAFVTQTRKASISSVQRKLRVGYNRAARMVELMETAGVVSEVQNNGQREVLAPPPPRD